MEYVSESQTKKKHKRMHAHKMNLRKIFVTMTTVTMAGILFFSYNIRTEDQVRYTHNITSVANDKLGTSYGIIKEVGTLQMQKSLLCVCVRACVRACARARVYVSLRFCLRYCLKFLHLFCFLNVLRTSQNNVIHFFKVLLT
jgi:hypothetical protein